VTGNAIKILQENQVLPPIVYNLK